jgi:hypothetical protein
MSTAPSTIKRLRDALTEISRRVWDLSDMPMAERALREAMKACARVTELDAREALAETAGAEGTDRLARAAADQSDGWHIEGTKAVLYGAPIEEGEPGWDEHSCDAMGCSSIAHVLRVVDLAEPIPQPAAGPETGTTFDEVGYLCRIMREAPRLTSIQWPNVDLADLARAVIAAGYTRVPAVQPAAEVITEWEQLAADCGMTSDTETRDEFVARVKQIIAQASETAGAEGADEQPDIDVTTPHGRVERMDDDHVWMNVDGHDFHLQSAAPITVMHDAPVSLPAARPEAGRTSRIHELKTRPEFYGLIASGVKTFEIRKNDRGFAVGDRLILRELDPASDAHTGRMMARDVSYVTDFGQLPGYVVMGIVPAVQPPAVTDEVVSCAKALIAASNAMVWKATVEQFEEMKALIRAENAMSAALEFATPARAES